MAKWTNVITDHLKKVLIPDLVAFVTRYVPTFHDCIRQRFFTVCGLKEGLMQQFSSNGKLTKTAMFVNGFYHGNVFKYYQSGKRHSLFTFDHNKRHGPEYGWYANGRRRIVGSWFNDLRHGVFFEWDSEGSTTLLCTYVRGRRHGDEFRWHTTGWRQGKLTYCSMSFFEEQCDRVSYHWNDFDRLYNKVLWKDHRVVKPICTRNNYLRDAESVQIREKSSQAYADSIKWASTNTD